MTKVWLKGEFEFASLFSYRIPNFSPAFAPSSPMPGPSAVKLALVSTRIETTGEPKEGEALFDMVKNARVGLEPASWLSVSRTFLRRLKRMKDGSIDQSFGVREYIHQGGSVGLYLEVEDSAVDLVADTFKKLRRIGTSDSLLYCTGVSQIEPDLRLIAQPLENLGANFSMNDVNLFVGRPVVPLLDIEPNKKFKHVNPYQGGGNFTFQQMYIFPLRVNQTGDGWVRYRREPFEI